ncbi:MAG: hydrolase [Myxococcota bacterium]
MLLTSDFQPAWWLPGPHLMTIYPTLFRRRIPLATRRERFTLPDGDFLDLDWVEPEGAPSLTVLILHGLEGSIDSPYARGLLTAIRDRGWRGVLMHFRGCSGEPNRKPRAYHSGETEDATAVIAALHARVGPIAAVGYSLGGNVLLKYLGEQEDRTPLRAAVAVSVPLMLSPCAARLQTGFSRVYDKYLLRSMKQSLRRKRSAVDLGTVGRVEEREISTIRAYDELITAPLHGFADAEDYYAKSSSRPFLKRIQAPTLIIHAEDDPFMTSEVIPGESELSDKVTLELSSRGGHVAFVGGAPWRPDFWLERRIPEFIQSVHSS